MRGDPASPETWVLDKRIPIALVVALFVQSLGAVWWAATMSARMTAFETTVLAMSDQASRIVKLEAQGEATGKTLERVETKVDKILEGPSKK